MQITSLQRATSPTPVSGDAILFRVSKTHGLEFVYLAHAPKQEFIPAAVTDSGRVDVVSLRCAFRFVLCSRTNS